MNNKKNLLKVLTAGTFLFSALSLGGEALAAGKKVNLNIESVGDSMSFNKKALSAPAGSEVTLSLKNNSKTLKHNWVLTKKGTGAAVANEGIGLGESKDYLNKKDKNIIAFTHLSNPGKTVKVTFKAPPKGTYDFVCTSPGHNMLMKGDFTVK
jgi:azurin